MPKTPAPQDFEDLRLIRPKQLLAVLPLSLSRIRQLEAEGEFPQRIAIGEHSVAYRASEVRAWIEARAAEGTHTGKGATVAVPAKAAKPPVKRAARGAGKGGK
jgi:predicted DNA-binding transcriptional regulator AlpA